MTDFESSFNWAKYRADIYSQRLIEGTDVTKKFDVYVSFYHSNGMVLFSIRVNEIHNRVNDLELPTVMFISREFSKVNPERKRPFYFFPEIKGVARGLQGYQAFFNDRMRRHDPHKIEIKRLYEVSQQWEKKIYETMEVT